jgi:hypothetical protein
VGLRAEVNHGFQDFTDAGCGIWIWLEWNFSAQYGWIYLNWLHLPRSHPSGIGFEFRVTGFGLHGLKPQSNPNELRRLLKELNGPETSLAARGGPTLDSASGWQKLAKKWYDFEFCFSHRIRKSRVVSSVRPKF